MPDDSSKIYTLIALGQQYENTVPDSAKYYYNAAGRLSRQLNFPSGIIKYTLNYTAILNTEGKYDSSLQLNLAALALSKQYRLLEQQTKLLANIGVVYQYKENYAFAVQYYLEALPAIEKNGNSQNLGILYGNLSGMYRNLAQYAKAMEYARKSLQVAEGINDAYSIANADINIGNIYKDYSQWDEALAHQYRAYDIGMQEKDLQLQETSLLNIADILRASERDPAKYGNAYQKVSELADSLGDPYVKSLALLGIALTSFNKRQFKLAQKQAQEALQYAEKYDRKETLKNVLLLMADIENISGDFHSANKYRAAFDSLSEMLSGIALQKNIQELETKYDVERKQSELLRKDLLIAQKNRETLRQKTWLIVLGAGALLLILLLLTVYKFYRQREILNTKALEAAMSEQENIRLKSTIDGQLQERKRISQEMHDDIGSGLTSVLFLSRSVQGQDSVTSRLKNLAQDLVQKMNEIIWTMNHEQDTLDNLIAYMRKQMSESLESAGIDHTFTITDPILPLPVSQEFRRNIYLVGKEAIHNIIKHAEASFVETAIEISGRLKISIHDNGKGFSPGNNSSFGNGLKNMQLRIEQLNGKFTVGGNKGTTVTVDVPIPV